MIKSKSSSGVLSVGCSLHKFFLALLVPLRPCRKTRSGKRWEIPFPRWDEVFGKGLNTGEQVFVMENGPGVFHNGCFPYPSARAWKGPSWFFISRVWWVTEDKVMKAWPIPKRAPSEVFLFSYYSTFSLYKLIKITISMFLIVCSGSSSFCSTYVNLDGNSLDLSIFSGFRVAERPVNSILDVSKKSH